MVKGYTDLAEFLEAIRPQTGLPSLPRNASEIVLAQDPMYGRLLQSQLDSLLDRPEVMRDVFVLDFFELSDEYRVSRGMADVIDAAEPPPQAGPRAAPRAKPQPTPHVPHRAAGPQVQSVIPLTWPSRDHPASSASSSQSQAPRTVASLSPSPLSWDTAAADCAASRAMGRGGPGSSIPGTWPRDFAGSSQAPQQFMPAWDTAAAVPVGQAIAPISWGPAVEGRPEFLLPAAPKALAKAAPEVPEKSAVAVKQHTVDMSGKSITSSGERSGGGSGGVRPWCVICMENPEEIAVDPCGHLSMCAECADKVQQCPVCRGPVEKMLRVFVAN